MFSRRHQEEIDWHSFDVFVDEFGFREFVMRLTESGSEPLEVFKKFKQVSDECWESPNVALRLYLKGMKYAVENYTRQIIDFLQ